MSAAPPDLAPRRQSDRPLSPGPFGRRALATVALGLMLALLAAAAGAPLQPAAAQPSGFVCDGLPGVYLYAGLNHTGRCLRLTGEDADLSLLAFEDRATSLRFVGPWTATLFVDRNVTGAGSTFTADDRNLGNNRVGSDRASSLRVQRGRAGPELACDGGEGVYLYSAPGYRGRCLKLTADLPDLRLHAFDDLAASLWLQGDWQVTLYRDPAYTGISTEVLGDDPDLADAAVGDNSASSIQVQRR